MRLVLPKTHPGLQIWDMATPPMSPLRSDISGDMFPIAGSLDERSRFCTITLGQLTGLTFVMSDGHPLFVHGHTAASPRAELPASFTSHRSRNHLCSIYVPLSAGDCITAMGARQSSAGTFQIMVISIPSCLFPLPFHRISYLTSS